MFVAHKFPSFFNLGIGYHGLLDSSSYSFWNVTMRVHFFNSFYGFSFWTIVLTRVGYSISF